MFKNIYIYFILLLFGFFYLPAQVIVNYGSSVNLHDGIYVYAKDSHFFNKNNGHIILKDNSRLKVTLDVKSESGTVKLMDNNKFEVLGNFINYGFLNIFDLSNLIIIKNLVNNGHIYNEKFLDIGKCIP